MTVLVDEYKWRYENVLNPIARNIEQAILGYCTPNARIDRISVRSKGIDSFIKKAEKEVDGKAKYLDPINQIQDQIGARIVTFFSEDVSTIAAQIKSYFRHIEAKTIVPDSEKEFGYIGRHFILVIPEDAYEEGMDRERAPKFFELQVKTLFQHAWAQAEHDIGYKPGSVITKEHKRKLAFTAAQAWGADLIFNELHKELNSRPDTP